MSTLARVGAYRTNLLIERLGVTVQDLPTTGASDVGDGCGVTPLFTIKAD
jgi:hypothetical protein